MADADAAPRQKHTPGQNSAWTCGISRSRTHDERRLRACGRLMSRSGRARSLRSTGHGRRSDVIHSKQWPHAHRGRRGGERAVAGRLRRLLRRGKPDENLEHRCRPSTVELDRLRLARPDEPTKRDQLDDVNRFTTRDDAKLLGQRSAGGSRTESSARRLRAMHEGAWDQHIRREEGDAKDRTHRQEMPCSDRSGLPRGDASAYPVEALICLRSTTDTCTDASGVGVTMGRPD